MINPFYRVLIIGAGQLGSRHLQGLARISLDTAITVIDHNPDALAMAKQRYEEMPSNFHVRSVSYHQDIPGLDGEVDLAIIATNADVRRQVTEELLDKIQVRYLILEKVVFQSIEDFERVIPLLDESNIKAWVNCPRRVYPFFRKLKKETLEPGSFKLRIKGSSWGLASNAIHMLDLLAFLTGQTNIIIDITDLDDEVFESKRKGFIELGGRLQAETSQGEVLELVDDRKEEICSTMHIEFNGKRFDIEQQQGLVKLYSKDFEKPDESPFHMPLQSEITVGIVEQILENGNSGLTSLDESYLLHRPMLDAFNQHLSTVLDKPVTICPIT